jgi:nucleobase transporter 1/2
MREVQGAVIGSGFIVFFIGVSGLLRVCLHYISPLTVAANIGIVGLSSLSLYNVGFVGAMNCPQLSLMLMFFIILFSQYMRKIAVPIGSYK